MDEISIEICGCGGVVYPGGYCFSCGKYKSGKDDFEDEELDLVDIFYLLSTIGLGGVAKDDD